MKRLSPRRFCQRLFGTRDTERGASPASVVILLGVILMFAELIIMGGRIAAAHAEVNGAAREGARRGSIAQTASSVDQIATNTARANVAENTTHCVNAVIDADARQFGEGGQVTVKVTCRVQLSDLSLLSLPWGSLTVEAESTEVVEYFRAFD